jgi:hypothetical protein
VIVPGRIAEKLRQASADGLEGLLSSGGLGGFLTDKEIPESFAGWASHLVNKEASNVGLALRWEAGLAAMEALSTVPDSIKESITDTWAHAASDLVRAEPLLDLWCVERSIISIRVSDNSGGWLNMSQLRNLFQWMSMDISGRVPDATPEEKEALATTAYIGQPVDVSESYAIVRIALGAESMLSLLDENKQDEHAKHDMLVVKKLAAIGRHFESLSRLHTDAGAKMIVVEEGSPTAVVA